MVRTRMVAGGLLLLPLALAMFGGTVEWATCDWDCGERGRGYFLLFLLCAPPAAVGALLLVSAGLLPPLVARALTVGVACFALLLVVALVFAVGQAVHELTREGQDHVSGPRDGSADDRAEARRAGVGWVVVSAVLAAMTAASAAAVRAAWRRQQRSPPPLRE